MRIIFLLLITLAGALQAGRTEEYDLLIKGGRVVDGTGSPWYDADVAVRGDRIVKIGRLDSARGRRVIDATGLIVAPGFVDMLGQSEVFVLIDPRAMSK